MDVLILVGGFTVFCMLGMPVAYALGISAIFAALWIDLPLEAIMLQTSAGMSSFSLLAIALVNILASTMFGCISGSSVADTASIGAVMIPQMIKNGYPRLFAVNVTISGSLQPLLIPPSHNAVIYSVAAGGTVSVAHLFMAGVIPGLLLGLSLMILCLIIAYRQNFP